MFYDVEILSVLLEVFIGIIIIIYRYQASINQKQKEKIEITLQTTNNKQTTKACI